MTPSQASADWSDQQTFAEGFVGMLKMVGGLSAYNPQGMKQNCVSVTFAKLLDYPTVNEFWYDTLGHLLDDKGMTDREIEHLLRHTGWQVHRRFYTSSDGRSAYQKQQNDFANDFVNDLTRFSATLTEAGLGPRQAAVYTRKDGTRHCVVAAPDNKCYQHVTDGVDVTDELIHAENIIMYGLRCPHGSKEYLRWSDRFIWNVIRRRKASESPAQTLLSSLSDENRAWLARQYPKQLADLDLLDTLLAQTCSELEQKVPCPFVEAYITNISSVVDNVASATKEGSSCASSSKCVVQGAIGLS